MQILKSKLNIQFMAKRRLAMIFSVAFIIVSLFSVFTRGLSLGIDFTGGTLVEVGYQEAAELQKVRQALADNGFGDAMAQHFGSPSDVLVRLAPRADVSSADLSNRAFVAIDNLAGKAELRRVEFVGPQVGGELTEQGGLAMLYALIGILIYVALRFEYRFAVGSVIALVHDVLITIGVFSLLQIEFDLPVLAAILAVIGYSLNDTIVVYDRIRENFRRLRKETPEEIINISLNQTLSRTLMTSITTLLVLIALFVFGGEIIHGFAFALIVGVVIGTYSSIYVASSAVLYLGISKADLMEVKKEGSEADGRP